MLLQVFHVGVTFQEPQEFVDDRLQMEFLGGEQRKTVVEVVAGLGAEDTDGWVPKILMVPVPVRSPFSVPSVRMRLRMSKYCFIVYL